MYSRLISIWILDLLFGLALRRFDIHLNISHMSDRFELDACII
jgi:hypothetical protein